MLQVTKVHKLAGKLILEQKASFSDNSNDN